MDLAVRTTTYAMDARDWLDSEHGTDATVPVSLDVSAFNAAQYPNGFIPSGCALAPITASGKYGPYDDTAVDGRAVLAGHLYAAVKVNTGSTTVHGAMLRHGFVKENHLPFQSGQAGRGYVDANGKTDVKGFIGYRTA